MQPIIHLQIIFWTYNFIYESITLFSDLVHKKSLFFRVVPSRWIYSIGLRDFPQGAEWQKHLEGHRDTCWPGTDNPQEYLYSVTTEVYSMQCFSKSKTHGSKAHKTLIRHWVPKQSHLWVDLFLNRDLKWGIKLWICYSNSDKLISC